MVAPLYRFRLMERLRAGTAGFRVLRTHRHAIVRRSIARDMADRSCAPSTGFTK